MDANVCPYCGKDYRVQAAQPKKHTVMPAIGGILIIVGGALTMLTGISLIASGGFLDSMAIVDFEGMDMIEGILAACGAIFLILGLIGVLGGVFALLRKHFGLAILGGVFALIGWFLPALVGLILVAVSRDEFE